jgi:lysophospholipase L1-like esterase
VAAKTGAVCRNYGIGGTRIAKQRTPSEKARWDLDFCGRVAGMDPDADAVVVFGGTNDSGHGDAAMGTMADRTPDTFYGALHTLYTSLIEKYPAGLIVVATPIHRDYEQMGISPNGKRNRAYTLKAYVDAIREVAEFYALPVLDLYARSGLQPQVEALNQRYFQDGLHPNEAGHQVLARQMLAFLESCPDKAW